MIQILASAFFILISITKLSHGFSECPNSNLADPNISGVTDCQSWLAYVQYQGINPVTWCSISANYQKCCLTCQNYQALSTCADIAVSSDCLAKKLAGQCNLVLADSNTVGFYCQKTCGLCTNTAFSVTALTCTNLVKTCNTGSCSAVTYFSTNTIKCSCPASLAGSYCQRANSCVNKPCGNGVCTSVDDENILYKCTCAPGYSGINCQTFVDPCKSFPCQNSGVCLTNATNASDFFCICLPQYSGSTCQNPVKGTCSPNPCNGGLCSLDTSSGTTKCLCPPGYGGELCQNTICSPNPCLNNGVCTISSNSLNLSGGTFTCTCPAGFSGSLCQNYVNPCLTGSSNPCQNGGTCTPISSVQVYCTCPLYYTGPFCSTYTNNCGQYLCQNNGICTTQSSGVVGCTCLPGYSGAYCQFNNNVNACSTTTCYNGGTCVVVGGQPQCSCKAGFTGFYCQTPTACGSYSCQNGGTCRYNGAGYSCLCPANVYGTNCEYVVTTSTCNSGDNNPVSCATYRASGFCSFTYSLNSVPVPIYCPSSCGLCRQVSSCSDSQQSCLAWANANQCSVVNSIDPNLCKRSCGLCGNLIKK